MPHSAFCEIGPRGRQLARYDVVIQLRTPDARAYNLSNPARTEGAEEAALIDARIVEVWQGHPHRHTIDSTEDFLQKAQRALTLVLAELPAWCRP